MRTAETASPWQTAEKSAFGRPGGEPEREGQSGLDLVLYLKGARKHRFLILGMMVTALVIGVIITLLTPPTYIAAATIQIDREASRAVDIQERRANENANLQEFLSTQYGLLQSRSLAERVSDDLGLARSNDFLTQMGAGGVAGGATADVVRQRKNAVVGQLLAGMSIAPVPGSRLVRIRFASPDPALSARVANAYAENFIQQNIDRKFESSAYIRQFLEERLAQTKDRLAETERMLVGYASDQQIINITEAGESGPAQSLASSNLVALNTALATARAERVAAEARWRQASAVNPLSLPDVLGNSGIQSLVQQRATLEADYQQRLSTFKPDYPAMVQLRAQIDSLAGQINNQAALTRNSIRDQYVIAANQERALAASVEGLKGDVLGLRERSIQYNILQRELDTTRGLYDALLQRYKEIGVTGGVTTNNVQIIDIAQVPGGPSSPNLLLNALIAMVIGLALGAVIAFILEALDESLATPEDVETKIGVPALGVIPLLERGQTPAMALADIRSAFSEAYYALRAALQFSTPEGTPSSMLVTSSRPGEGKSTTAFAVAHNLARVGHRVLLVDGDLRRPSLHRVVGGNNDQGLSNILSGSSSIQDKLQKTSHENLSFLSCGPIPPNPAELWGSDKINAFLSQASSDFDHVVIDGPPVLGFADVPILASKVAGVLFVAESKSARRSQAKGALRRIQSGNARVLGVVLTKFNAKSAASYGSYNYAYDYEYGSDKTPSAKPRGLGRN